MLLVLPDEREILLMDGYHLIARAGEILITGAGKAISCCGIPGKKKTNIDNALENYNLFVDVGEEK